MKDKITQFMEKLEKIPDFHRVRFVILYGSRAEGRARKNSDYDFAIYYEGSENKKFKFLLNANFDKRFDAKIFQDLPLFIRKEVLKGRVIYAENLSFVYDVAYQTIKEFERFKKYYYDYLYYEKIK